MIIDKAKFSGSRLDLAEVTGFTGMVEEVPSFDARPDSEVRDAARSHADRVERERALWEYGYRKGGGSISFLRDTLRTEEDAAIRWNILWLALKLGREEAIPMLEAALSDDDREVRDWAKCYLKEVAGAELGNEYDEGVYEPSGPFDQTLPLQIAGFALLNIPDVGALRATLSPLWFEQIMGRVLACTNLATFMKDLIIEKCLEAYHPDGSDHYEIFPFSGVSWTTPEGYTQHRYESITRRSFYRSGKVEDRSKGVDTDVPVILNRSAGTTGDALRSTPVDFVDIRDRINLENLPDAKDLSLERPLTDARGIRLLNGKVVRTVRGQFFGWAYTSLDHYISSNRVLPGTVQLVNPLHEATADLVNTYLCGTFRGKLGDYDGDGKLDINLIPCHGTVRGELDYGADGSLSRDPWQ